MIAAASTSTPAWLLECDWTREHPKMLRLADQDSQNTTAESETVSTRTSPFGKNLQSGPGPRSSIPDSVLNNRSEPSMGRAKKPKPEAAQVDPEDLPLGTRKPRSKLKRGDRGNEEAESAHAEGGKGVSEVNPAAMPSVVAEAESNFEGGVGVQRAEAAAAEGGSGDRAAAGIAAEDQPVGLEVSESGAGARLEVASAPTEVGPGGAAGDVSGVNLGKTATTNPPAVSELSALGAVRGATQKAHDPELGKKEDKGEAEGTGEGVTKEPPEVQVEGLQGRSSLEGVESSAVDIEKKRSEVSAAQEKKSGEVSAEMSEEEGKGTEHDKAPPKETPLAKPTEKGGAKNTRKSGKGDATGTSEPGDGGEKEAPTGAVGSGDFFGPSGKINPERMEYIRKLAQEFKEGKGGEEA
ncbi:hypothetical protein KFL_012980020 [Klebsormidium nitens]|uniref:Uncharacterized protein n=1 Tax=Klebsormidium nitens TaxID=105231 RepID=A0A1Y1IU44_KLENI|nr:hypothetical protein KFL_012980020 [Klebsormidium nitens]|eukprot:GAQ93099.1 hypothetical protein KFL_012980020 [Klebsormidium nitens]